MTFEVDKIFRKNILSMKAYSSARSLATTGSIFLDANEIPDEFSRLPVINRYPDPKSEDLRSLLAEYYAVNPNQIFMGRGSDEAIDILIRIVCEPSKDVVLSCPPTYGMYDVATDLQGALKRHVPMRLNENGFTLNIEQLRLELNDSSVKVFFLCRPNNPTGETLSLKDIEVIAQIAGPNRLLIIDEAYIEFSSQQSATTLIKIYPNIVVLRTFSKAWAMAGARFGVAISSQEASAVLEKVRAPYPISVPVRDMIVAQLNDDGVTAMKNRVQQILVNRAVLEDQLKTLESVDTVFKSDSNYLLVKAPKHARSILAHLRSRGIVLRDWSGHPLLEDCIRITVGSAAENSILLSAWQAWERALYA